MKTLSRIGILTVMLFLSSNVFAQTSEIKTNSTNDAAGKPGTHLGLLINMVNSNVDYGQSSDELWGHKSSSRGLQIGATFQAGITSRFSLVSEFYYMKKGGQVNAANSPTGQKTTLRFHTLEVPVLARIHFGKFHVNAGPSLTYNLSGKLKSEGSSTAMSFNKSEEGFKRFDAGVQFGGGYKFRIKQRQVVLDLRYSRGLTNLSQSRELYSQYLNLSLQIVNPWKTNPLAAK
ncbi:MAG TPA: porin family protein [Chryseosolibacter sp.]|nr:porin family protein [Chryseosolibacter sp.]